MTIIEAIKSGKAFRRKKCPLWFQGGYYSILQLAKKTELLTFNDILADDWQVREE